MRSTAQIKPPVGDPAGARAAAYAAQSIVHGAQPIPTDPTPPSKAYKPVHGGYPDAPRVKGADD